MPTRSHQDSPQSVTSAPESRTADQARRLKQYLLTMGIRTACFVLLVVVHHPVRWVFAAGAVFLPFFAVVAANAVRPRVAGRVRPVLPGVDDTHLLEREPWHEPVEGSSRPSDSGSSRPSDSGSSRPSGSAADR